VFLWYQISITLILGLILLNLFHNLRVLAKPARDGPLPDPVPLVSILIPARNEVRNIVTCLRSLLAQDYPALEILVLDDHSEDGTDVLVAGLAAQDPRLKLLRSRALPEGWHGKAYACHQLAEQAQGEWLLFTDADTIHAPDTVSSVLRTAVVQKGDLISFMPQIITKTFWERVVLPLINFPLLTFLPLGKVNRQGDPRFSAALGPFMFFRRSCYLRLGGHAAVRDAIVEDMWLGRLVKAVGGRLLFMDGSDLVRVRFYRGLREAWKGLSKSTFAALDYALLPMLLFVALNLAIYDGPVLFLAYSMRSGQTTLDTFWLPLLQIVMAWRMRLWVAERFRMSPLFALLHPLTILMGALIAVHSVWCSLLGPGVLWKGRSYQFGGRILWR